MMPLSKKIFASLLTLSFLSSGIAFSQSVQIDASKLVAGVNMYLSPRSGSFTEGSTFEVPILLNTRGQNINGIEARISFDHDKLTIIAPSGGKSIIGVWVEPPTYDNSRGTASYIGVVPEGITTNSGLIGTITFKAKKTGQAIVSIGSASKVLLHDGLGTEAVLDRGRAAYDILPKAPDGVLTFSETHPSQSSWYNNNSPVISWGKTLDIDGFSFEIDDKPFTIPDNIVDGTDTTTSFNSLHDGLWYFHIKGAKRGAWGNTTHFLVRIDSTPPAEFKPETNYVVAALALVERTLVSFFTTDNLSGIDYYEVGVIDKNQPPTESPVFVQSASPFQVPLTKESNLQVIVRAVDKAGNVRDASVNVKPPFVIAKFVENYLVYILLAIILIGFAGLVIHYLVGHHIIRYMRRAFRIMKREEEYDKELPPAPQPRDSLPLVLPPNQPRDPWQI